MQVAQRKQRGVSGQVIIAVLLLTGGLFVFTSLQRQLIYFPEVATETALLDAAGRVGMLPWRSDNEQLIGWRTHSAGNGARRLVVFHGNAGYALHRHYFAAGFLAQDDPWEVYLFEYPGYGARPGEPSEAGIKAAAADALAELLAADPSPLYLVGESLGSGVASHVAGRFPQQVAGLLLVTPFTELADVASEHYGMLPVRAMLSERFDSVAALGQYRGPVAFLIAGDDEIVPARLGHSLHDSYQGPKWLFEQPGAGHNTLDFDPRASWWRQVVAFWQAHPG